MPIRERLRYHSSEPQTESANLVTETSPRATYAKMDSELECLLSELTPKQELFCREYFITLNATDACARAGYKGTRKTLSVVGCENLGKPSITRVMDAFFDRRVSDININASLIEREYWKLYNVAMNEKQYAVARSCLKDLGEHHAMFIKVVASAEAGELALRLAGGRSRMNDAKQRRDSGLKVGPVAVGDSPL